MDNLSLLQQHDLQASQPQASGLQTSSQSGGLNFDPQTYSYYQQLYNAYQGHPTEQNAVIQKLYDSANPSNNQNSISTLLNSNLGNTQPTTPQPAPVTANNTPVQPVGTAGLGTDPGNLFGEGGALGPSSIPRSIANLGIGSVVSGLINPLFQGGQVLAGTVSDLMKGKSLQDALANPNNAVENTKPLIGDSSGANMNNGLINNSGIQTLGSNAQYMSATGNPLQDVANKLKPAAGIASFAAPEIAGEIAPALGIGGTIATRALQGGASGTLAGLAGSAPGQELSSALTSGATGAVIGPVAGAAGDLLQKVGGGLLNRAGTNLRGDIVGVQPQDLQKTLIAPTLDNAQAINDNVVKMADEAHLPTKTSLQLTNTVDTLARNLGKTSIDNFSKVEASIPTGADMIQSVQQSPQFQNYPQGSNPLDAPVVQKVMADMAQKLTADSTLGDIKSFQINDLRPLITQYSADATQGTTQAALHTIDNTIQTELLKSLNTAIEGGGDNAKAAQTALSTMKNLQDLHIAQDSVVNQGAGQSIRVGKGGVGARVNPTGLFQRIQSGAGKLLQSTGNSSALGAAGNLLQKAAPFAGAAISNQALNPTDPSQVQSTVDSTLPPTLDPSGAPQGLDQAKQIASQLLQGGYTATQIKSAFSLKGLPNPFLSPSATQATKIRITAQAYNDVGDLITQIQQNRGQLGSVMGGTLGNTLSGSNTGNRQVLLQGLHNIASEYNKAVGDKDITNLVSPQQDPQTIINNLSQIQQKIYNSYNTLVGSQTDLSLGQ